MALARTDLLSQITGSPPFGTGALTTTAFTPPSNSLLVVGVHMQHNAGSADYSATITCAGGGWTYTRRVNIGTTGIAYSINVVIFTAPVTTGASMQLTIDCGAENAYVYGVSVVAYTGYDTSTPTGGTGTVVDTASPDGAQSITLSAAPVAADEVFAILGMDKEQLGATPGSGFTEIHELQTVGESGFESEIRTGSTSTTVDWVDTHTGTGNIYKCSACAVVIKASGAVVQSSINRRRALALTYR